MNLIWTWIYFVTFPIIQVATDINIGGIFDGTENDYNNIQEWAFKHAISRANEDQKYSSNYKFDAKILKYERERNALLASRKVCSLMEVGIAGLFGPQYGDSAHVVQDICDLKEIPHIQTQWDLKQLPGTCSVNFHPYPNVLAQAFLDIVREWQWSEYTILYENTESFLRILTLLDPDFNTTTKVKLQKIYEDYGSSYRSLLRKIKDNGNVNIVLDCSIEILPDILQQAQQIGLMGSENSFLITNLDFHTLDLVSYQYGGTNITSVRLFHPETVNKTVSDLNMFMKVTGDVTLNLTTLPVDAALIYDAVTMYVKAISEILDTEDKREIQPLSCNSQDSWFHGYSIINHIKLSESDGLTGLIKFDHRGYRTYFDLHIFELGESGFMNVGKWNSVTGVEMNDRPSPTPVLNGSNSLRNSTMNVLIPLTSPYGMRVKSHKKLDGNDQYEGFCVDLLKELSSMNGNFNINFIISRDGKSGSRTLLKNKTIVWDGMIGAILRGEADLACADLTVNREREEAVDFTSVFMNLGIAILYKKPKSDPPGFFSFLSPFKSEVWLLVFTAYVGVSLSFFVIARISPYEWTNPFPCVQEPEELENQFTLANSFWFTIGALMQQGSEIAPISVSTRLAAGVWWFFTLIMVACYTANLAAFLTTENPSEEFSNIDELAMQTEIKYGAKKDGTTLKFFNESSESLHKQMFNYMTVNANEVLTQSTAEGVKRAANEKYAFLMESSQIEYETERECSLTQIGKPIDDKGYAIAMEKDSWYLGPFSQSILKMQEEGKLSDLKRKWWKEKYAGSCTEHEKNDAETLGLMNLGGVFIVLGGGVAAAIIIAKLELFLFLRSASAERNIPMKDLLIKELRFFLLCRGTMKPASTEKSSENSDC